MGPKSQALSHPTGHSFSLSLSLFFFICSSLCSSSEQKAHTHRPLTRTAFFLLSSNSAFFLFFLFCSYPIGHSHADPSRENIGVDLQSHVEKLHHELVLLIAAIVLVLRSGRSVEIGIHSNDLVGASKSASTAMIWSERRNRHPQQRFDLEARCRRREQLRWKLVFDLEAFFFFFFMVHHK